MDNFKLIKQSNKSKARLGVLQTAHGKISTPFFMPVATQGAVKHVSTAEVEQLGAEIILSNTYHLMIRPGEKLVKKLGGLHKFIGWDKPILTDSGGFQVFSLSGDKTKSGENLVKVNEDGAQFRSYVDGKKFSLTPEKSLQIQTDLGVDIAVCLDVCPALPATDAKTKAAVDLTIAWARRTKKYYQKIKSKKPLLHAVIQGGLNKELRLSCAKELMLIGFDGYNVGGLSVGESNDEMYKVLDYLIPVMPEYKPRYLMGVGYPENIVEAVKRGVDMFDCVIPTREGRHGRLFIWNENKRRASAYSPSVWQNKNFYRTINIINAKFANDKAPINKNSKLPELRKLSKAYLHYLFKINEPLGQRLATLNNLEFYLDLMIEIRSSIKNEML
jgi:queuine tRNA-ribosyltransferase